MEKQQLWLIELLYWQFKPLNNNIQFERTQFSFVFSGLFVILFSFPSAHYMCCDSNREIK